MASRKDNLRQHHSKIHGIKARSGHFEQQEKPLRVNTVEDSHFSDVTTSRSSSVTYPVDKETWTCAAFLQGATVGSLFVLEASLRAGIDVNVVGDDKSSALHCAARAGHSSAVQCLLECGADLEARNCKSRSPLHEAILGQDLETVDTMFRSGAKLSTCAVVEDFLGQTDRVEILKACLTHFGTKVPPEVLGKVLKSASRAGNATVVGMLLSFSEESSRARTINNHTRGPASMTGQNARPRFWEPIQTDARKFTTLHLAAAKGHLEVVKLLVDHRFNINSDVRTYYPLHLAAREGHANIVEFLLKQKTIDIKRHCSYGLNPLHYAAMNGKVEVVKLLLRYIGFDAGPDSVHKNTPLHLAARSGQFEAVRLLLQHPHQNNIRCANGDGQSPLQLAALHGHWDVAQTLLNHEDMQNSQGATTALRQKSQSPAKILQRLLEHTDFSDVNLYDKGWRQSGGLLHAAIQKDAYECIQILLSQEKIDVNLPLYESGTPLCLATKLDRTEAVKLLLQHKNIDVNKGFGYYWKDTELLIARKKGHCEIVDLLLAHGAKDTDITAP
jgi:ankyrin repeat protein